MTSHLLQPLNFLLKLEQPSAEQENKVKYRAEKLKEKIAALTQKLFFSMNMVHVNMPLGQSTLIQFPRIRNSSTVIQTPVQTSTVTCDI